MICFFICGCGYAVVEKTVEQLERDLAKDQWNGLVKVNHPVYHYERKSNCTGCKKPILVKLIKDKEVVLNQVGESLAASYPEMPASIVIRF